MHRLKFPICVVALATLVFAGLYGLMRGMEARAIHNPSIRDQLLASGQARPVADVARTIARMALVTAEVHTSVRAETSNDSWRGTAVASVEAPVILHYGVDVSQFDVANVGFSPATSSYLIRIPPPRRISTEVCGDDESTDVRVGWARLRTRAGEYYLGQARKNLYTRAREITLSQADAIKVRETTRTQVEEAVRLIVGRDSPVTVIFDDSIRPTASAEDQP